MWKQKTNTGRVVYERDPHKMKWRDARRIINKLEVPRPFDQPDEYLNMIVANLNCQKKVAAAGAQAFLDYFRWFGSVSSILELGSSTIQLIETFAESLRQLRNG